MRSDLRFWWFNPANGECKKGEKRFDPPHSNDGICGFYTPIFFNSLLVK